MSERACRDCRFISYGLSECPNCGSKSLSKDFVGVVEIFDVNESQIAKRMGVKKNGRYAIRVR